MSLNNKFEKAIDECRLNNVTANVEKSQLMTLYKSRNTEPCIF